MKCMKFVKAGGGRGRPPYNTACAVCGTIYTDHPDLHRDRYKNILAPVVLNITAADPAPQTSGQPIIIPSQISYN